tara:strand:+ start:352 stop:807 length:456 start_codon:yes stop_codon:yes gene_type:complete
VSFASDIKKFAIGAGVHTDEAVRAFNTEITRQVIQLTPVGNPDLWKSAPPAGYAGGQAKANWFATIGQPSTVIADDARARNATKPMRWAEAAIQKSPGEVYYLANNLPYIRRLEYEGWSTQAPAGMVRITMAKANRLLKAQARKANKKPKI